MIAAPAPILSSRDAKGLNLTLPFPDITRNLFDVSGFCSVVTGAGQGIGKALATGFAHAGSDVVLVDRNAELLDETAAAIGRIGPRVALVVRDVTATDAPERIVAAARDLSGRIDVLVNNAGIMGYADIIGVTDEEWDRMYGVNLRAPMRIMREVLKEMVAAGRGSVYQHRQFLVVPGVGLQPGRRRDRLLLRQGGPPIPEQGRGPGRGAVRGTGQRHRPRSRRHPDARPSP